MATPAVNLSEDVTNPTLTDRWNPSIGWYPTWPSYGVVRRFQRQRPASVEGGKRPDKTWPPKPWLSQQFSAVGAMGEMVVQLGGTNYRRYRDGYCLYPPNHTMAFFASYGWDSSLQNLATQKALAKLKDSKVNLGVALAEARKTAELLGRTSTGIAKGIDAFMDRNWKRVGKMTSWKRIPAKYLELCYGWTPLLNDVYGSAEHLAYRQALGYPLSLRVTAAATGGKSWSQVVPGVEFTRGVWSGETEEVAKVSFTFDVPNSFLREFTSVGLTNPATIAWELVPYSFVLDWLLPVGNWLDLLDAGAFLDYREGSLTRFVRFGPQVSITAESISPASVAIQWAPSRAGRINAIRMQRSPLSSVPWYGFPQLRNPLSLDKAARGLALLTQVLKKWA